MPIIAGLEILLQVAVAVHAVRTGRSHYWLFIIMAFPVLGCAIYLVAEVLPELRHSRAAQQAAASVQRVLDPDRELRRLTDELDTAETVENRRLLAEERLRRGEAAEAVRLYEGALTGMHRDDPALLMGLARARFADGDAARCTEALDRLKAAHPNFQSAEGHLLYARALEAQDRLDEALGEYAVLAEYYPGVEAKCRYALLLQRRGRAPEAGELFRSVVRSYEKSKRFRHATQREWYDIARQNLGT